MEIRYNSKRIIKCLLDNAILQKSLSNSIDYADILDLCRDADIDNSNEFHVCMEYLQKKGLVKVARTQDAVHITLTADAVDFLEVG